jgi:hypothetical protein
MSDFFEKIRSGAGKVAKEADQFAHVKRIELEIGSIKKQVEDNYKKLGEMTYRSNANKEPENPEAQCIMAKITELNKQINVKEMEIKSIDQGAGEQSAPQTPPPPPDTPKPPTTGKKACTNCGKENDNGVEFCSECGAKMG